MEPSFEQVVALVFGELEPAEASRVEAAASASPRLAEHVRQVREVLRTLQTDDTVAPSPQAVRRAVALLADVRAGDAAPTWLERATRVIAQIVFDSRATPALAGVRGSATGYQLGLDSTLGRLDLQVVPTGSGDRRRARVRGHIESVKGTPCGPVSMISPGTSDVVVSTVPDEHGRFRMDLPLGTYDLMIAFEEEQAALIASDLQIS